MAGSHPIGPRVTVTAPDGEAVTARLLEWHRWPDGWWAHCCVSLWTRTVLAAGPAEATPYDVAFTVPKDRVVRVEGEDYRGVPVVRHRTMAPYGNEVPAPGR